MDQLDQLLSNADAALAEKSAEKPEVPVSVPNNSGNEATYTPSGRLYVSPNKPKDTLTVQDYTGVPGNGTPTSAPSSVPENNSISSGNSLPAAETNPQTSELDALRQLDDLTSQAMKEKGIHNYVPPIADAVKTPEGRSSITQAGTDFFAGFNYDLAKMLSLPEEVTQRGLALLGVDYMEHGSPTQRTVAALNRMGIPTYAIENLANKAGQDALPALATWAAMQVSAPFMATQNGTNAAAYIAKNVGEWALKHPVLGAWLGQTSNIGGHVATNTLGDNPMVQFGGELAGGTVGNSIVRAGGKLASNFATRGIGRGINWAAEGLPTGWASAIRKYNPLYQAPVIPKSPIAQPGIGKDTMFNFAEDQVAGLKMQMDDAVSRAIERVSQTGPSNVQSQVMHLNLQQAEKISNSLVEKAWNRVNQNQKIGVDDMFHDTMKFARSLWDTPSVRPSTYIRKALDLSRPEVIRDAATGRVKTVKPTPSVRRLRDFVSEIRNEIVREQASDAPRDGYIRNLNQLRDIVENNLYNEMKGYTALEQARAASTMHHDMFSRGPIADVLAKRYRGDFRVAPGDATDKLINTEDGGKAVRDMVAQLSVHPQIGRDDAKIVKQVQVDMENAIRNAFREAADPRLGGTPQRAMQYQARNAYGIRHLAKVSAELKVAVDKVKTALDVKKDIERSAFARFAETTPEKAVANLFSQKDPASVTRELVRQFSGDTDALAGLRNTIVEKFLADSKNDPMRMKEMLGTKRISDLLNAALSTDQYRRLNKVVTDAVRLTSGEDKGFARSNILRFTLAGRVFGAWVGRQLPGTTLQGQSIFSRTGARIFERIMRTIPPDQMVVQAIIDPQFEHLLYSRLPVSTKEMKAAGKAYRRVFAILDTARNQSYETISGE